MIEGDTHMTTTHLQLWQTEWCPASHRVRQRLTELGLSYLARPVPVASEERTELEAATGARSIPVLIAGGEIIDGEQAILTHLDTHYQEPPGALEQRTKAAKAKHKELEQACPKLTSATP
jgi:glutathione S-transferase